MKDEIKEILDKLLKYFKESNVNDFGYEQDKLISYEEAQILLDYITNLQEENHKLKELCDKYEEEHSAKFNEWVFDKKENERLEQDIHQLKFESDKEINRLKTIIKATIVYIETEYESLTDNTRILAILNGDENDNLFKRFKGGNDNE